MQYIYVRTKGLLEKAGYIPKIEDVNFDYLKEKEVVEIIKLIYQFSDIIKNSAEKNEPSILARYLINLAQGFSNFYNEYKVIVDDKELQNARLYMTYAVGRVLKTGAELLGMEMPNKM